MNPIIQNSTVVIFLFNYWFFWYSLIQWLVNSKLLSIMKLRFLKILFFYSLRHLNLQPNCRILLSNRRRFRCQPRIPLCRCTLRLNCHHLNYHFLNCHYLNCHFLKRHRLKRRDTPQFRYSEPTVQTLHLIIVKIKRRDFKNLFEVRWVNQNLFRNSWFKGRSENL